MKRPLVRCALALSVAFPICTSPETISQTVNLTVVSRCGMSVILEKAGVYTMVGRAVVDMPLTRVGLFFYTGHAPVTPGQYHVGVSVGGTVIKCWGGAKATVLPGHDRDVGIEVTPLGTGHYDAYAFLYGTLPFKGFVRGTLIGKNVELPVDIDHSAYFVEHAYPGNYLLKLSYGDSLECRIQVVIPTRGMRVDISVQEAQQCLGFPYHLPSTGERGFVPVFPSPSPSP